MINLDSILDDVVCCGVSVLNEKITSSLTDQEKKVLAIALARLGSSDQDQQDPLNNRMFNGMEVKKQQFCLKAIEIYPSLAEAYNNLGLTLSPNSSVQLHDGTYMTQQQLFLKTTELNPSLRADFI